MVLFDYKNFLIKEKKTEVSDNLVYSDAFIDILKRIDDGISKDITKLKGKDNQITYVDVTDKKDTVSFIQTRNLKGIIDKGNDPWKSTARQELKVGRFAKKLLGDKFPQKSIEEFVNSYKASYEFNDYVDRFKIVDGKDMTKFYYCNNQVSGGQLSKSCMGYSDQQPFIREFFESNPKTIKMLVLMDKEEKNKIVGRANLWYLDDPDGRVFMDRIYTNQDYLVNIFIEYATINDFIYKSRQIYGGHVVPVIDKGKSKQLVMSTEIKKGSYKYYPYVDTLQFYNKDTGEITNDTSKWDLTEGGKDWIALIHAGGRYLTKDNDQGFKMDYLGRLCHPYFVKWSKIDNCYIHNNDAVYLAYKDDYCVPEREIVEIDGRNYLKEDTIYDEKTKTYTKK